MKKILFTGITGLLGKYFLQEKIIGFQVFGISKNRSELTPGDNIFQVDIAKYSQVISIFNKIQPEIVIHAASIGSVDYCEQHPDEAYSVNVEATKNILNGCKAVGSKIIFTSSNAVYDGKNPLYDEKSERNPIDVYGKTKKETEDAVMNFGIPYIIVRLMTMYGWNREGKRANPVTWVIDSLKQDKKIQVVNDIFNNHLWAGQASSVLKNLIYSKYENEQFNVAGADVLSRYDLALKTAKVFALDSTLIEPVPSSYFDNIAPRPKNTSFDTSKIEKWLRVRPLSVLAGLKKMKYEKQDKM